MSNPSSMFECVLNTQGRALERMMTNQDTANPAKMEQAKQLLEEAICLAIQAAREVNHEVN
ncbi:hypothetical protein [Vibrio vulnificus]|uniref:hypothetical protein n=1 Tax=Vibrio vulnificus TaxID=672 RepID=UPI00405A0249